MPTPRDKSLYNKVKQQVYKKIPKHSAYRSGIVVQKYKQLFNKKHPHKNPYIGKKQKKDLAVGLRKNGAINVVK